MRVCTGCLKASKESILKSSFDSILIVYGVLEAQSICGSDLEGEESVWIEESVKAIVLEQVS